jgi:hypothetical protein
MSDTPRTDDKAFNVYIEFAGRKKLIESDVVDAEVARELERELNLVKQQLQDAVKRMEEVKVDDLCSMFVSGHTLGQMAEAVRARLIQAAKGEQP